MRTPTLLPVVLLALTACVTGEPSGDLDLHELAAREPKSAAVLPFSGTDGYPRVTADWIAFRLAERGRLSVVTAERSGLLLRDAKLAWPDDADPPPETVRAVAALLHADFLVGGRTAPKDEHGEQRLGYVVAISVWDGATGRLAGRTIATPPPVMTHGDYTLTKNSANHAAECVLHGLGIAPAEPPQGE